MEFALGPTNPPALVLDTNVALDWLVFANPAVAPLAAAIQAGRLHWLACPRMRDELARTLTYPSLAGWNPDSERVLTTFDRWAMMRPHPAPQPLNPICTDPDDQVFIDLALAEGARWLLTRDRALLKLARRAQARGVQVVTPERWMPA